MANDGDRHVKDLSIINERGLYARAAARFVKPPSNLAPKSQFRRMYTPSLPDQLWASSYSVAGRGSAITVHALEALVAARFDEAK